MKDAVRYTLLMMVVVIMATICSGCQEWQALGTDCRRLTEQ